jgi:putative RecB family exonuclease
MALNTTTSLRVLRQSLHLSYSQITTYLNCSLKYYFQYVKGFSPEHISSSLLLGAVVHTAMASFYERIQKTGTPEQASIILELLRDTLSASISHATIPICYKSEASHPDALIAQGEGLIEAFLSDPGFAGLEVVAVELPLATRIFEPNGVASDFNLVGAIDLLLRDQSGNYLAVDHKTAKTPFTQQGVDNDLQLTAYALLLHANGYLEHGQPLTCGFNVLRKLKTPKVERLMTVRTPADTERFSKIAQAVLNGIEAQTFLPSSGWMCGDCPFKTACRDW